MGEKRKYTCEGGNIARNGPEGRGATLTPKRFGEWGNLAADLDPVVDELNALAARIAALESQLADANEAVRVIVDAIKNDPELPGPLPDEMWAYITSSREAAEDACRSCCAATKKSIMKTVNLNPIARAAVEGKA